MDCLYFCGNSLGLQPKEAQTLVVQEMDKWQQMYVHVQVCQTPFVINPLTPNVKEQIPLFLSPCCSYKSTVPEKLLIKNIKKIYL